MSAEDLVTGKDIAEAVLEDAGEIANINQGDYVSDVRRYVREAYWDVLGRYRWNWAMSPYPGVLTTSAAIAVTVSGISGTTLTLSTDISEGTGIYPDVEGRKFYLEGNSAVYYILEQLSPYTFRLDGTYVESVTSGTGKIFKDIYTVDSTVLKIWEGFRVRGEQRRDIPIIGKEALEADYGIGVMAGPSPFEKACEMPESADGLKRYRFAPWSEERFSLEYDYTKFHNLDFSGNPSTDTPKIPQEFRGVLVDLALYKAYANKEDSRAVDSRQLAENTISEMATRFMTPEHASFYVAPRNSLSLGCT